MKNNTRTFAAAAILCLLGFAVSCLVWSLTCGTAAGIVTLLLAVACVVCTDLAAYPRTKRRERRRKAASALA